MMIKKSIRKTLKFKGKQYYAGYVGARRITGNFDSKSKVRKGSQWKNFRG